MEKKCIPVLLILVFVYSCSGWTEKKLFSKIDTLKEFYPDSAFFLLENSLQVERLNDEHLAKWCLLDGELRDKLNKKMDIDVTLLRRAITYYKNEKESTSEAKAGLYLGRVYAVNRNYKLAMASYMPALKKAYEEKEYNLAGYISSYIADLYSLEYDTNVSYIYYTKARAYFLKAGNIRSSAIALRDIGKAYILNENPRKALPLFLRADSVAKSLNDTLFMCSMANYIGNAYAELKQYTLAEQYYLKSIRLVPKDNSSNYSALVDVYISQGRYKEIKFYLDSLSASAKDLESKVSLDYQLYTLEKKTGNTNLALHYLEQCDLHKDSIEEKNGVTELYEIQKKYEKEQVVNENQRLKIRNQWIAITVLLLVATLGSVICVYQLTVNRKKKNELRLQLDLKEQEIQLKIKEKELSKVNKRMDEVRELLLLRSFTFQKVKLLSDFKIKDNQKEYTETVKEIFGTPSLINEDWNVLKQVINETYPSFTDKLQSKAPSLSEDEIRFCCLLNFNLNSAELLVLLNLNPGSLRTKRYRINQKIRLIGNDLTLEEYLSSLK